MQKWRQKNGSEIGEDEKAAFLNLMRRMLVFRPEERPTANEVLQSEWMVKWGLPFAVCGNIAHAVEVDSDKIDSPSRGGFHNAKGRIYSDV